MWINLGILTADAGMPAGPILPQSTAWAGIMLIVIAGILLMAVAVGLAVRFNAPDEVPPTHAHDEPPGTSHHHGPSGEQS